LLTVQLCRSQALTQLAQFRTLESIQWRPRDLMSEPEKYTPLAERLQQDVWHDNFVPKYSALATAEPSKLVLVGVWLIFAPMAVGSLAFGIGMLSDPPDRVTGTVAALSQTLVCLLATVVLFVQTRRYWLAQSNRADDGEYDEPSFDITDEA